MDWLSAPDQGASQGPFKPLGLIGVEINLTGCSMCKPSGTLSAGFGREFTSQTHLPPFARVNFRPRPEVKAGRNLLTPTPNDLGLSSWREEAVCGFQGALVRNALSSDMGF
jgi:hypothetical protein